MLTLDFSEGSKSWSIELSNEKGERFIIEFENGQISTNRLFSGKIDFNENFANKKFTLPTEFDLITNATLILDKASVEMLFNNGRYSMTNIFFPTQPYTNLKVTSNTAGVKLKSLTLRSVKKTW
jgi:sucrose-6-phosphate hydrolase SacC (GH32 family)